MKSLDGTNGNTLRQIAAMCRSAYDNDGTIVTVFGTAGEAVAELIDDHLSGRLGFGASEKKEKQKDKPKGDPQENRIIAIFIEECGKATGAKAIVRWGTDRLHVRKALAAGWQPDDLVAMIKIFFEHGKTAEGKFTFKNGSVKNFVDGLTKLCVLKSQANPGADRRVHIPDGEVDAVGN